MLMKLVVILVQVELRDRIAAVVAVAPVAAKVVAAKAASVP